MAKRRPKYPTPLDRYGLRVLNPSMKFPFEKELDEVLIHMLGNVDLSIRILKARPEYTDIGNVNRLDVIGIGKYGEIIGQRVVDLAQDAIELTPMYRDTIHVRDEEKGSPEGISFPDIRIKDIARTCILWVDDAERANDPNSDMEIVTGHYRIRMREPADRGRFVYPLFIRFALVSLSDRGSSWPLSSDQVGLNIHSEDTLEMYNYCMSVLRRTKHNKGAGSRPIGLWGLGFGGYAWVNDMYHRLVDEEGQQKTVRRLVNPERILDDRGRSFYIHEGHDLDIEFDSRYIDANMMGNRCNVLVDDAVCTGGTMTRFRNAYENGVPERYGNGPPPLIMISMVNLSGNTQIHSPIVIKH